MTLLAELFERMDSPPVEAAKRKAAPLFGVVEVGATAPAFAASRRSTEPPPAPAPTATQRPVPAAESTSAPPRNAHAQNVAQTEGAPAPRRRNAWTITRGGRPICRMVGAPCTRTEALAEARWRWPDADILEN